MLCDEYGIRQQIIEHKLEHRDLDVAIRHMIETSYVDQLQIHRMKKRKLYLKDAIARLQSGLIPDRPA